MLRSIAILAAGACAISHYMARAMATKRASVIECLGPSSVPMGVAPSAFAFAAICPTKRLHRGSVLRFWVCMAKLL
jgi:hypothetical protein